MASPNFCRQLLAEHLQLVSFRGADVRREAATVDGAAPLRSEDEHLRKLAGGQPGKPAPVISATEGEAPVALKPVPAQIGDVEAFPAHGFHRVAEERRYFTDLDSHVD